jgi:hypothetical protein
VKIFYQVSRIRLSRGAHPSKAFLCSLLNRRNAASEDRAINRVGALAGGRKQARGCSLMSVIEACQDQKQDSATVIGVTEPETRGRFCDSFMFHLVRVRRFLSSGCENLKQFADRIKYNSGEVNSRVVVQTLTSISRCLHSVELELSGSEAKFFLDRNSGRENIDRKIFGDYSERAKFHLQAFGNLLNWRSYVLGWEGVSLYAHESARLRKAVSPKQGLATQTNHQHQASGKKRLLGFFLFPADMEESDLYYELESEECGQKGAGSYCVIG